MVGVPKRPRPGVLEHRIVRTPPDPAAKPKPGLKQELDEFKKELLAELAKILGEVQAAQILGYQLPGDFQELDDTPMYIPETIGTGENIEAEINVQSKESDSESLDDAAEALRKIKQKKEKKT